MIGRCHNPKDARYQDYGGRGIAVCERWRSSFEAFLADVGTRPDGTTIDRIDNARGYEPGNVRWATYVEQANNSRKNHVIEFGGKTLTLAEWGRAIGLTPQTIYKRLQRGWPIDRALAS